VFNTRKLKMLKITCEPEGRTQITGKRELDPSLPFSPLALRWMQGKSNPIYTVETFVDFANIHQRLKGYGQGYHQYRVAIQGVIKQFARHLGMPIVFANSGRTNLERAQTMSAPVMIGTHVWCSVTYAVHVHRDDALSLQRRQTHFRRLTNESGFTLIPVPVDYHGYHLHGGARQQSPKAAERNWFPKGKGCDIALSTRLTERLLAPDRPSAVILVSGDADFAPALYRVVQQKLPVKTVVASFAQTLSAVYSRRNHLGYQWPFTPIIMDQVLDEMGFVPQMDIN
jgi:hypothetical protein